MTTTDELFLLGYSEGGYATMALHRELQQFHSDEFTVTASAPMAGPWSTTIILPYQRQLKFPFSWWEIGVE